jgi:N utilization substance protein A
MTFLLKKIEEGPRGKEILLSRADPAFVEKLFAREVPEISSGSVTINAIAREPGVRTKIAVASSASGVDPVGSCVGQKGVRVQAVTNELGGERVDIVPYSEDLPELVKASLSPAEGITVEIDQENKVAKVKAPEDQLSLAIGKEGQNVRLAAKLTGLRIEVEGVPVEKTEEEKKEGPVPETEIKKAAKKEAVSEKTTGTKKPTKKKEEAVEPAETSEKEEVSQDSKAEEKSGKQQ